MQISHYEKIIITCIGCLSFLPVFPQVPQPSLISLTGIGGSGTEVVTSNVSQTQDKGFLLLLSIVSPPGTGNVDSFCSPLTKRLLFIKYNDDASVAEWSKCYGYEGDSFLTYLFPGNDGSDILGGYFAATVGGGFLISKHDASDNIVWQKNYSKGNNAYPNGLLPTEDGGYIMMGAVTYTDTNALTHYGSNMEPDIWLMKLDKNGDKVWSRVIGGSGEDKPTALIQLPGKGFFIVGTTSSNDYDCTGNHGGNDAYLLRLDTNGNILWHRDIGGSGNEGAAAAVLDGKGGLLIYGYTNSTDGDVSHPTALNAGLWIINVDSLGNKIWDNCYGGPYCLPSAICKSANGHIWCTGVSSRAEAEFDVNYGREDALILHTDSAGTFLNAKVLGGSADDRGIMIHPLSNGNILAGGWYSKNDGFFTTTRYYGAHDTYLAVFAPYNQTGLSSLSNKKNGVKIFPNPATKSVTIEFKGKKIKTLEICDVSGKIVYSSKSLEDRLQIPVQDWQKGIYSVYFVDNDNNRETRNFLVK